jgi:hypothetical protein
LSWGQNSVRARHLALAFILASTASAALADILVVRSTGPSARAFPPGKSLPEAGSITLKPNDMLVVLDGRGTRTLRGPGTFAPGAAQVAARPVQTAIAGPRRARIGAVRGTANAAARPATLWHVDVSKSSNICLADPSNVTLWRADSSQPVTLTIAQKRGASQQVTWPAGANTLSWPSGLRVADGADYSLSWAGAAAPTLIRFKTLSSSPAGLEQMASSLIMNQCNAQLDHLIETVKLPDDPAPTG